MQPSYPIPGRRRNCRCRTPALRGARSFAAVVLPLFPPAPPLRREALSARLIFLLNPPHPSPSSSPLSRTSAPAAAVRPRRSRAARRRTGCSESLRCWTGIWRFGWASTRGSVARGPARRLRRRHHPRVPLPPRSPLPMPMQMPMPLFCFSLLSFSLATASSECPHARWKSPSALWAQSLYIFSDSSRTRIVYACARWKPKFTKKEPWRGGSIPGLLNVGARTHTPYTPSG
jgi:hypothetical protein